MPKTAFTAEIMCLREAVMRKKVGLSNNTCRVRGGVEQWGWKPSWQELSREWEVSRGRSCERGGEMKESEDTGGAQGTAAFQARGG